MATTGSFKLTETDIQYLVDSLDIIERNCRGFEEGHHPDYRVVAGQLRILLCDSNRGKENSLALRVFPELKLHPLRNRITEKKIREKTDEAQKIAPWPVRLEHWEPYGVTGIPEHARCINVFDLDAEPIPLEDWREQFGVVLAGKPFTLREMIKSVADKGGGTHADESPDSYLATASKVHHKGLQRRATGQHEPMMIALGEYIVRELRKQLQSLPSE